VFAAKVPPCSILEAELWGIFHGLKIVWSRGFQKIKMFVD